MAPKHAATAAVFTDSKQIAYGVLTNVSVTGACIVTNSRLAPGSEVDLEISFYQQLRLYGTAARVVWNRLGGVHEKGFEFLPLQGVHFTFSSALQKSRLHALLAGEDFLEVFRLSATEFDLLQNGLAGELDELGSKMHKITGEKIVTRPLPRSLADTDPEPWELDTVFERIVDQGGGRQHPTTSPLLRPSDTGWHALPLEGFGKLRLQEMFQFRERPLAHLAWIVYVAGQLTDFPDGLILHYAIRVGDAGPRHTFHAASKLRSLASGHLKRDLCQAVGGELPASARGIVFLSAPRAAHVVEF